MVLNIARKILHNFLMNGVLDILPQVPIIRNQMFLLRKQSRRQSSSSLKLERRGKAHISASWSIAIHRSPVASPAQLLLNRRLRSILPYTEEQLKPKTIDMSRTKSVLAREKLHQKKNYDKHPSKHLQPMHLGDPVIVRKRW